MTAAATTKATVETVASDPMLLHQPAGPGVPQAELHAAAGRLVLASGLLAGWAAAWMVGGVFLGPLGRLFSLAAASVGAAGVAVAARYARSRVPLAYINVALLLGLATVAALTGANTGGAGIGALLGDALRRGFGQPPVPFDPGWRFFAVLLCGLVAAFGSALALATERTKLGVAVAVPFVFGAALRQPASAAVVSAVLSFGLLAAAFATAHGAELARAGSTSGEFEVRRLLKGGGILIALLLVLLVIGQQGLLLPKPNLRFTIPAKRPQSAPPQADHELFGVATGNPRQVWRLGVLDGYDGEAFLTPPFDSSRVRDVPSDGNLHDALVGAGALKKATVKTTFTLTDLTFQGLPVTLNPLAVRGSTRGIQYDPRTQSLLLANGRPAPHTVYTVESSALPTGADLEAAPAPEEGQREFLKAPDAPGEVRAILAAAPANPFDRMQYVREAYYRHVVAAGGGQSVPVPPSRVVEILRGQDASPFEITAGEVLMTRWAGVPARLAYGYFSGEPGRRQGTLSVHPRNGATWLESYFRGYGWIPVLGTPPKARSSLNNNQKNKDPNVLATDDLALILYVPVRQEAIQFIFELLRFYAIRVIPLVVLVGLALAFYPILLRAIRRRARGRWAARHGIPEMVLASYSEFRDGAADLNIGQVNHTPLEFLNDLEADREHEELAWLVTRLLWGDLRRAATGEDARACREMAGSLTRRLRRKQPLSARITAAASRKSLRTPFASELPNTWWGRDSSSVAGPRARRPARRQRLRHFLAGLRTPRRAAAAARS